MFLEISQNSQENICARASFLIKVAGLRPFFIEHLWWLILKVIATLFSVGKASQNRVTCFSRLFLTKLKVSINVWWHDHFCCSTCVETIVFLGKSSKPFFYLSNQRSIMQYLNFFSKKPLFLSSIYLRITVFPGFLTIINKLPQQKKK